MMLAVAVIALALGTGVGFAAGVLWQQSVRQQTLLSLFKDSQPEREDWDDVFVAASAWADAEKPRLWS